MCSSVRVSCLRGKKLWFVIRINLPSFLCLSLKGTQFSPRQNERCWQMRKQGPESDSGQMIFTRCPDHSGGTNKCCWGEWLSTCKRMKLDAYPTPDTRTTSIWTKDQDIGAEPQNSWKNTGEKLHDVGFGSDFLDLISKDNKRKNIQGTTPKEKLYTPKDFIKCLLNEE